MFWQRCIAGWNHPICTCGRMGGGSGGVEAFGVKQDLGRSFYGSSDTNIDVTQDFLVC